MDQGTTERPIYVSAREYDRVREGLFLPDSYLKENARVADIGGGFSNFAARLKQVHRVEITVIDPIAKDIGQLSSFTPEAIREYLAKFQGGNFFLEGNLRGLTGFDPSLLRDGSVYELSQLVSLQSFDLVLAYRLGEYINLGEALPEMVYALAPGGEIRMGGMLLSAVPQESRLYGGVVDYDGSTGEYTFDPQLGFPQAMSWLKNRTDAHTYVAITAPQGRSEVRKEFGGSPDTHGYVAGLFIIRLDAQLPRIQEQKSHPEPEIGRLFEIDPSQVYYDNNRPEFYDKNTYVYCKMARL